MSGSTIRFRNVGSMLAPVACLFDARTWGLYRMEPDGSLVRMGTFPAEHWSEPRAVVLAPSLDGTDDPERWHPFVLTSEGADGEVHERSVPRDESESS